MRILLLKSSIGSGRCQRDMDSEMYLIEVFFSFTSTSRSIDTGDD